MSSFDPSETLTLSVAEQLISDQIAATTRPDAIGVEVEFFAFRRTDNSRVALADSVEILNAASLGNPMFIDGNPIIELPTGGAITFEPGGQIEYAAPPFTDAHSVGPDLDRVIESIERALDVHDIVLVGAGTDPHHNADQIPQQLPGPRYQAMARYFDSIGPWGRVMMRNTSSIQVSLDLQPENYTERWRLANLLAPIVTATFANSPSANARNTRAFAWQQLDNSRTGFPLDVGQDAMDAYVEFALSASVLLFHRSDDTAFPGIPGFSFGEWIERGHAVHGRPKVEALRYHLTTLFPEVRLRDGLMELRSVDGLPKEWASVPPLLLSGAIYDEHAQAQISDVLTGIGIRTADWWRTASVRGLGDPTLRELASEVWQLAVDGRRRLDGDTPGDYSTVIEYLDRFTYRGLSPADSNENALVAAQETI